MGADTYPNSRLAVFRQSIRTDAPENQLCERLDIVPFCGSEKI